MVFNTLWMRSKDPLSAAILSFALRDDEEQWMQAYVMTDLNLHNQQF